MRPRRSGKPALGLRPLLLLLVPLSGRAAPHYGRPPCQTGEVQGEVLGASGYLCAPRCEGAAYSCAVDVPFGSSAQPNCMLQDISRNTYCGLLCQVDSQCPSGARCQQIKQADVGLCMFPLSFTDWARGVSSTKLAVGWPSGQPAANSQVTKTYAALQNLKQKFSIDDGDADMITLKELLSSLTTPAPPASPHVLAATPSPAPAALARAGVAPAPSPPVARPQQEDDGVSAWARDIDRFQRDLSRGLPGIEGELEDTMWNVEHITRRNAAAGLLRGLILLALGYLAVGSFIKYHTAGARGIDMIPHISFWMEYPQLVMDGVTYSKIIAGELLGSPSGGPWLDGGLRGGVRGGAGAFEAL